MSSIPPSVILRSPLLHSFLTFLLIICPLIPVLSPLSVIFSFMSCCCFYTFVLSLAVCSKPYRPASRTGALSSDVVAGSTILARAALLALGPMAARGTTHTAAAIVQEQKLA